MPRLSASSRGIAAMTAPLVRPHNSAVSRSVAQKTSTGTAAEISQTGAPADTGMGMKHGRETTIAATPDTTAPRAGASFCAAAVEKKRQETSSTAKS